MATVEFRGRDLVVWFREHPSNGQEWQYRVRYECANQSVTHYVNHTEYQSVDADEMRVYKDALTYEENVAAGVTRSPKVFLATQIADGKWSEERLIESNNPAPPVPPMSYMNGYDMVAFSFDKPQDSDWDGFVVWADTQHPVRKDLVTSKYEGPDNMVQLALAPDTTYFVTYAAYDAFGTDALNEATVEIHTLSKESILLPVLNERLDAIEALTFKSSSALTKLANAYSVEQDRKLARAEERLGIRIDENGNLVAERVLTLETQFGDFQSLFQQHQQTQAGENEAMSQSITLLGARVGANETAIVEERTARATADSALTLRLDQQASRINDNEAQFADQIQTLVDEDGALALRITNQAAQWQSDINGAVTAATQTLNQNIANGDLALSQRIDTLSAQVGQDGWSAALQQEQTTRANADSALSQQITTATAGYDNKFATIQQSMTAQGNEIDGLQAQWTLRIDNNGRISGFGLASDPNGNSEFAVNADRFLIAHPGGAVPVFEVVAGQVRIKQAVIANAEITNANIQNLTIAGDKFENKATYDFSGHFANLNGWHVTSSVWNNIGGSYNPTRVTLTTGNGDNEVLIQLNATYSRDGGDDDNLDLSIIRSDGTVLGQIHTDVQVQSGKRTMTVTFFDPSPNINTTYSYTVRQRARGNDGSPYWYNIAFWGVCFKK